MILYDTKLDRPKDLVLLSFPAGAARRLHQTRIQAQPALSGAGAGSCGWPRVQVTSSCPCAVPFTELTASSAAVRRRVRGRGRRGSSGRRNVVGSCGLSLGLCSASSRVCWKEGAIHCAGRWPHDWAFFLPARRCSTARNRSVVPDPFHPFLLGRDERGKSPGAVRALGRFERKRMSIPSGRKAGQWPMDAPKRHGISGRGRSWCQATPTSTT